MNRLCILAVFSVALLLGACDDGNKNAEPAAPTEAAPAAAPTPTTPATPEAAPEVSDAAPAAEEPGAPTGFDINQIPLTDKDIGAFPFFTPPEGYKYENVKTKDFDRYYFAVREKTLVPIEGRTFRTSVENKKPDSHGHPEILLVERNYENAITTLGGVKVFNGKFPREAYQALSDEDGRRYGPELRNDPRQTYVIRKLGVEIWVEITCNSAQCKYVVAQKGEMKQTVGLVPASAMKTALDKEGHIALYINFDVDKATIKPDSQATVEEIAKLLESYPDLNIRIEGHTDNTGEATHNQTLSENRAAAVFGSLLAKGIPQSRLSSQGFGATKPIAENQSEEGRAKNRRV
ncbi:MAG: OmpA family protein, partial [Zoogloeaceae bacterium]|nr:OmpA family protein [Zoogloeaceae bacterium]